MSTVPSSASIHRGTVIELCKCHDNIARLKGREYRALGASRAPFESRGFCPLLV